MNKPKQTCYMCEKERESLEHVPPKCLFPKTKKGLGFHKAALIKVPSCREHNNCKSKDDEHLLFILTINIVTNTLANEYFKLKVINAAKRSPNVYKEFVRITNVTGKDVETIGNYIVPEDSVGLEINREQFDRSMCHIAHGIYFHHHNWEKKFSGKICIFTDGLLDLNNTDNERTKKCCKLIDELLQKEPIKGCNHEVFTYQILEYDKKRVGLKLTFYGEFKVRIIMKHSQ